MHPQMALSISKWLLEKPASRASIHPAFAAYTLSGLAASWVRISASGCPSRDAASSSFCCSELPFDWLGCLQSGMARSITGRKQLTFPTDSSFALRKHARLDIFSSAAVSCRSLWEQIQDSAAFESSPLLWSCQGQVSGVADTFASAIEASLCIRRLCSSSLSGLVVKFALVLVSSIVLSRVISSLAQHHFLMLCMSRSSPAPCDIAVVQIAYKLDVDSLSSCLSQVRLHETENDTCKPEDRRGEEDDAQKHAQHDEVACTWHRVFKLYARSDSVVWLSVSRAL